MPPSDVPAPLRWQQQTASVLALQGADSVDLLQRLSSGDLRPAQQPGWVLHTLFCTNQGKLIDWCTVISRPAGLWLLTAASKRPSVQQWLQTYTIMEDVRVADQGDSLAWVQVRGQAAAAAVGLASMPATARWTADAAGNCWYADLPAYGDGLCGLVPTAQLAALQARLLAAGAQRCSAEAMEIERLRAGVPSPTQEYAGPINPLELRLDSLAIGWHKGCYIGQEVISRLHSYNKVARLLVGFEAAAQLSFAANQRLRSPSGEPLGRVTSLQYDAAAGCSLGLAVVKRSSAQTATSAVLDTGTHVQPVRLLQRPFFAAPAGAGKAADGAPS